MPITIGSRASRLAVLQVDEALKSVRPVFTDDTEFLRVTQTTIGDQDLTTPLTDASIPSDFFTRELDRALLDGQVDLVFHSAKDLPEELPEGIITAALLPARDTRDALVHRLGADPETIRVIGTSSPRREAHVKAANPDIEIKPIRGSIEQRIAQADAGDYDAVIIAACALHRMDLDDRISTYLDYETTPQQGRLAITARADDTELLARLRQIDVRRNAGLVALIGCPAEFTLFSQRALNYLREADVVLHDRLLPPEVFALIESKAVCCGKTGHQPSISQTEIHRRILHAAEAGQLVVRLHGGDPGILGHLGETLAFLSDWNLRADVLPAVTAAQLAASRARAPLTHRHEGRSITFLSGHGAAGYNYGTFPGPDRGNLGIYMGVGEKAAIQRDLQQAGWPEFTNVIVGERLGHDDEAVQYLKLDQLADADIQTPAVLLVGPTGFPSLGYTLFVGTDPELFLRHGPLLHLPLIQLEPTPLRERAILLRDHLDTWDGIIFPSRIAVRALIKATLAIGDVRLLAGKKLLAVGPATERELAKHGLKADAAPPNFGGAAALAKELGPDMAGRFLYPCSDAAPVAARAAALADSGIELDGHVFYRNSGVEEATFPRLPIRRVLFSSGSTARAYFRLFPDEAQAKRVWLAVGTSTLKVLADLGIDGELLPGAPAPTR